MGIISDVKTAADTLLAANKIPEYEKLLAAMDRIVELQERLEKKSNEVAELQDELDRIHNDQELAGQLRRIRDHMQDAEGNLYCIRCWTVDKRLGPIVSIFGTAQVQHPQCSRCKQNFASW